MNFAKILLESKVVLWCLVLLTVCQVQGRSQTKDVKNDNLFDITNLSTYPLVRNNVRFEMQSSYDRTGGNDDGFNGTYSVLRSEKGNSVIAETKGRGVITRIWFPYNAGYPNAPMSLVGKRIFIYLDGNQTPEIDLPIIELFNNTNRNFPYPLCGMALGGCWCHLPIAFNKGAKIVVEGDKVGFFQVQFTKFDLGKQFETFSYVNNPLVSNRKQVMSSLWNSGDVKALKIEQPVTREKVYQLKKGENKLQFIDGPAVLRAFMVKAEASELEIFLKGRLVISWDEQDTPAIDVPLSMFFIQENTGTHGKSLMAGLLPSGNGVYNFFPMPYQQKAKVKILMPEKCKITLTTIFDQQSEINPKLAYLNIRYHLDNPTTPGQKHLWLDVKGKGHFVGVYMRAAGESLTDDYSGQIYWTGCLEGDEVFEVDGKIVSHGTGTEDYFNAGWNGMFGRLDHAKCMPFHGYTLFDASKTISRTAAYRWHLPTEVIPFEKYIKATVEVGPEDKNIGNYESIAFYYLSSKN